MSITLKKDLGILVQSVLRQDSCPWEFLNRQMSHAISKGIVTRRVKKVFSEVNLEEVKKKLKQFLREVFFVKFLFLCILRLLILHSFLRGK